MKLKKKALVIVDAQNGFCEGGNLPVDGGIKTVDKIVDYLADNAKEYDLIVVTQDWHINPGEHFAADGQEPDFNISWPPHCEADTDDARLRPNLEGALAKLDNVVYVKKGQYKAAYSGFEGHTTDGLSMHEMLQDHDIDMLDTTGIAQNFCVKDTSIDGAKLGYDVTLLPELTVGIEGLEGKFSIDAASEQMRKAGVQTRSVSHDISL